MSDIAEYIEGGDDPLLALDDYAVTDPQERGYAVKATVATLQLAASGRARPHLGLLHPQHGAPRGPVPQ